MSLLQRILLSGNLQTRRSLTSSLINFAKHQDSSSSSDSDSSSDDERKVRKSDPRKPETKTGPSSEKLTALLKSMLEESKIESKESTKLNLAKPREKQRLKDLEAREKRDQKKFGEKLIGAAKEAAQEIGGDVKQNEAELLARLLNKSKVVQEESGKDDVTPAASKDAKKDLGSLTLNELLAGMKIDRSQPKEAVPVIQSRAVQVRNILGRAKQTDFEHRPAVTRRRVPVEARSQLPGERVDLFAAEPLGIFKQAELDQKKDDIKLDTWERCYKRELKLAVTQPPTNIYEQMILWTEKGMLWHFPIDNEQGLEEEKKFSFHEHIHLERHLEGWCPPKGPIRHFMELVCIGLSKNPWLTVDEKLQHIWGFRDFFKGKADLIRELGAGDIKFESKKEASA